MSVRQWLTDYSKGDDLTFYWKLFWAREAAGNGMRADILNLLCSRAAHRHGGYIGRGARLLDVPSLPHGLHGIYISRFATIGKGCRIYQNVTVGEVDRKAPEIGDNCLIGAGAVLIGGIRIGNGVKIGAGAVVCKDVPEGSTVVSPPAVILERKDQEEEPLPGRAGAETGGKEAETGGKEAEAGGKEVEADGTEPRMD